MRAWVSRLRKGYRRIAGRTRTKTQSGRVPARSFHISYFLVAWVNRAGLVMCEPFPLCPRKRPSSGRHGMSQTCHNQKFATAISSSQFVQAPQTEAAKRKPASIYSGHFSSMESVEKKRAAEPLFFAFIGKDATHHRRPYTSRTPGCSTPNAGGNGKRQRRSNPRS